MYSPVLSGLFLCCKDYICKVGKGKEKERLVRPTKGQLEQLKKLFTFLIMAQ
jgi:hypothetical protein